MNNMNIERFDEFVSNKNTIDGLIPFGGFIPEMPNKLLEAKEEQTYSKTPVLFTRDDIAYLMQFPPEMQKMALSIRYNNLLVPSKFRQSKGETISDKQDILIPGRAGSVYRFRNAYTGIKQLIDKLEKPRDTEALRHGNPQQLRQDYKEGLYGYNLESHGDKLQKTPTGQYVAKAFLGMSWDNANKIMNNWRDAIIPGWLGRPKVETPYKPISFGGGKPRGLNLDWHGNVVEHPKGQLVMPVYNGADLKRIKFEKGGDILFNHDNINETSGEMVHQFDVLRPPANIPQSEVTKWQESVIDQYYEEGKLPNQGWETQQSSPSLMPVLRPGALLTASAVNKYDAVLKEIRAAHAQGNAKQVDQLAKQAISFLPNSGSEDAAKKYSEIDYLLGRFNPIAQAEGLGREVFNTHKRGGVEVLSNTKETIAGTEEEKNILQKYFVYSKTDRKDRWFTIDLNGNEQIKSAVAQGVSDEFKHMSYNRGNGIVNVTTMKMFIDDFLQEAGMYVLKLAGDPLFKDFYKALKNKSPDLNHLYAQAWRRVKDRARIFTGTVAQFDWGQGTRRKLRYGGNISGNASIGDSGDDYFSNLGQTDKSLDKLMGKDVDDNIALNTTQKRVSGERSDVRTRGGINPSGMTANMFQSGHSPEAIAAEIAAHSKQREANIASGNWDEEKSISTLQKDVQLVSTLVQNNFNIALSQSKDKNIEVAASEADAATRSQLQGKGVKISKPMEQMPLFTNSEMPALDRKGKSVATPTQPLVPTSVSQLGQLKGRKLSNYIASQQFIDLLKNNPAELEMAKKMAPTMKSRALVAAITAAESGNKNIPINPDYYSSDNDAADTSDIANYRSTRTGTGSNVRTWRA